MSGIDGFATPMLCRPEVWVSRSRIAIARAAGTSSYSPPACAIRTIAGLLNSGMKRDTGSSSRSRPSSRSIRIAAAVIGLDIEANREHRIGRKRQLRLSAHGAGADLRDRLATARDQYAGAAHRAAADRRCKPLLQRGAEVIGRERARRKRSQDGAGAEHQPGACRGAHAVVPRQGVRVGKSEAGARAR